MSLGMSLGWALRLLPWCGVGPSFDGELERAPFEAADTAQARAAGLCR